MSLIIHPARPSGWIDSAVFYKWIANYFHPQVENKRIPFLVILFVHGHASHLDLETAEFCHRNGIILCPHHMPLIFYNLVMHGPAILQSTVNLSTSMFIFAIIAFQY